MDVQATFYRCTLARRARSLHDHSNKLGREPKASVRRTGLLPATDNIGPDLSAIIYYARSLRFTKKHLVIARGGRKRGERDGAAVNNERFEKSIVNVYLGRV